jgi:hypothetical protein
MTTPDQLLSLGPFLRARQADILAAWRGAIRDTWPHRADSTRRGAVAALLLDRVITAVERPPDIESLRTAGVDGREQTAAAQPAIAIDLALLRRVIRRTRKQTSSRMKRRQILPMRTDNGQGRNDATASSARRAAFSPSRWTIRKR